MRLPIVIVAAIAGLGLFCGSSQASRSWLPTTDNPYCAITTYKLRDVAEQGMSLLDSNGRPVIVVNAQTLAESPSYGRFLMAHECCHHTLGHVQRYHEGFGHVGPQPFFYIAPALKQMELDADCCAVKLLKSLHETDSIEAAEQTMSGFGPAPTGAYYPTGTERADNIAKCAAED
ncbi:MAG: hypothetical protein JJE37_04240 [Methyloceanibacter sp.]|nr:hypothetical protein [Methyloceanibacter sp.]